MLDTTFAVTGKTLIHAGVTYTIKGAGIKDDRPYAEVAPRNGKVTETLVSHIRKCMPLPFSLQAVQNELQ